MSTCPNCGSQQPQGAVFCDECGMALNSALPGGGMQAAADLAYSPTEPSAMAADGVCKACGAQLESDSAFCDMCGLPVAPAVAHIQEPPQFPAPEPPAMLFQQPVAAAPVSGYATPPSGSPPVAAPLQAPQLRARLVISATNMTLSFPEDKVQAIIGRDDPLTNLYPDVDLTDCGGDDAGVSRQHARIYFQDQRAFIEDRNSTNKTYLNGQQLTPWQTYPLQDGDRLRFGHLETTFYM